MEELKKIFVRFEPDEDGWPPCATESLWAEPIGQDRWRIRNFPFFAKGIAFNDEVLTTPGSDGEPVFDSVVSYSGHSLITIIVFDADRMDEISHTIGQLGYGWESFPSFKLVSVDIRPDQTLKALRAFLNPLEAEEVLSFCENSLAHNE